MAKTYRVGKYEGRKLKHSCHIERRADGGMRISKTCDGFTQQDIGILAAHFGRMLRTTEVVGVVQHRVVLRPGSKQHFEHAVCVLPPPFALMKKESQ
jgi:hypothetical protein